MGRSVVVAGAGHPPVSGITIEAPDPLCLLVLGHGAGAPMTHPFMEALAQTLATRGISTLRYNFAYAEMGRRRPDRHPRLLAVIASALEVGKELAADLPLFAGGKSMGGRMTTTLVAQERRTSAADGARANLFPQPRGLVLFGFPLHPPGRPGTERGDHLAQVSCPMLFLQGTRDRLADLELLRPVLARLGSRATLKVVDGGDHSFGVLKRSGRTSAEVLAEVADKTREWVVQVVDGTRTAP